MRNCTVTGGFAVGLRSVSILDSSWTGGQGELRSQGGCLPSISVALWDIGLEAAVV